MDRGLVEQAGAVGDGSAFGVVGAIIEAGDAGVGDGPGAHGAGFKRDPQLASGQPVVAERCCRLPQRDDFGMGGGVMAFKGAICAAPGRLERLIHVE